MSEVLFWRHKGKRDDPFLDSSPASAFYHPSLPRNLTNEESQTMFITDQNLISEKKYSGSSADDCKENIAAEDKLTHQGNSDFLSKTNTILAKELPTRDTPSPPDTSSKFNESWPESERQSSSSPAAGVIDSLRDSSVFSKPDVEDNLSSLMKVSPSSSSWTISDRPRISTNQTQSSSVLARYIHRFRHEAPRSREERFRDNEGGTANLWWLSPTRDTSSSSSSLYDNHRVQTKDQHNNLINRTVTSMTRGASLNSRRPIGKRAKQSDQNQRTHKLRDHQEQHQEQQQEQQEQHQYKTPSVKDTLTDSSSPHKTSMDAETLIIQEKAQHLLEVSESSLLSDPIISSEGIGSSSPSQPTSDVYIPTEISPIRETEQPLLRNQHPVISRSKKSQRDENDILYQWRLRRKMEEAKREGNFALNGVRDSLLCEAPSRHPTRMNMHELVNRNSVAETTGNQIDSLQDRKYNSQRRLTQVTPNIPSGSTSYVRPGQNSSSYQRSLRIDNTMPSQQLTGEQDKSKPIVSAPVNAPWNNAAYDIIPHAHMSCDIIPCSHGNKPHCHTAVGSHSDVPINVQTERIKSQVESVERDSREQNREESNSCDEIKTQTLQKLDLQNISRGESQESNILRKQAMGSHQRTKSVANQLEDASSKQELNWKQSNDYGMPGFDQSKTTSETNTKSSSDCECKIQANSGKEPEKKINQFVASARSHPRELRSSTDTDSSSADVKDTKQPRHVTDAIGQVIKRRLFGNAKRKQLCTLSKGDLKGSPEDNLLQDTLKTDNLETLSNSDNEEFKEDELLQILRRKRSLFENQLRLVDELISNKQGSG